MGASLGAACIIGLGLLRVVRRLFCWQVMRAHMMAEPVLNLALRYYGPVEGRVVALDRSASDALRLTLGPGGRLGGRSAQTARRQRASAYRCMGNRRHAALDPAPGLR